MDNKKKKVHNILKFSDLSFSSCHSGRLNTFHIVTLLFDALMKGGKKTLEAFQFLPAGMRKRSLYVVQNWLYTTQVTIQRLSAVQKQFLSSTVGTDTHWSVGACRFQIYGCSRSVMNWEVIFEKKTSNGFKLLILRTHIMSVIGGRQVDSRQCVGHLCPCPL